MSQELMFAITISIFQAKTNLYTFDFFINQKLSHASTKKDDYILF